MRPGILLVTALIMAALLGLAAAGTTRDVGLHAIDAAATYAAQPSSVMEVLEEGEALRQQDSGGSLLVMVCGVAILFLVAAIIGLMVPATKGGARLVRELRRPASAAVALPPPPPPRPLLPMPGQVAPPPGPADEEVGWIE